MCLHEEFDLACSGNTNDLFGDLILNRMLLTIYAN